MPSDYTKIREDNIKEYGEGTRHLAFLGKLYTDRTHFIFELLQNAEDAGASQIRFRLFEGRLEVNHDGRLFNEADVRGVCGVGEGTKSEDLTQIGKFGIGFKSVYAYSSTPEIHSGDENFAIEDYVRPSCREPRNLENPWSTLFVLPFNVEGVDPETACQEIGERLRNLSARTLLFLRSIKEIRYELPEGTSGEYLRDEVARGLGRHITVIGQNDSQEEDENWLVFERSVMVQDGNFEVRVEAGFCLETNKEDETESVSRVNDAPLIVFFPTEKETRLGFLIQGPYRTTPARDNIPINDAFNKKLIEETAELIVESLRQLKEMELLSVSLLEALPVRTVDFPEDSRFYPIFSRVREALLGEELLPADDGTFVTAPNAKLVRGIELMRLLNQDQLRALFQSDDDIKWLTRGITEGQTPDLRSYLMNELDIYEFTPERFASNLSAEFLAKQPDEWIIKFYAFLHGQKALWRSGRWSRGILRSKPIVRLEDGNNVNPFKDVDSFNNNELPSAYLAVGADIETSFPIVKLSISQDEEAYKFLVDLGIPELDIVAEVIEKILPRYRTGAVISEEKHKQDISQIEHAYKTDSSEKRNRLRNELLATPFVLASFGEAKSRYCKPDEVYFETDKLRLYFSDNPMYGFVSREYSEATMSLLENLDVTSAVRVTRRNKNSRGHVVIRNFHGHHKRGLDGFDPEIKIEGIEFAIHHSSNEKSTFIWNEIAIPYASCIRGTVESSSRQTYEDSDKEIVISNFGKLLIESAWLPGPDGVLHKPDELALDDLPESFIRDEKLADQLHIKPNEVAQLAEKIGVNQRTIKLARLLEEHPEQLEKFEKFLSQKAEGRGAEFPRGPVSNPERRQKGVAEQYDAAPEKDYETRERSVRTAGGEIGPHTYLKNQYTNEDGQLVCQICEEEMPFRKRDGEHYFEAVEALSRDYFPKELAPQFLALCPLCAAKYKEFVKRDEDAMRILYDALRASDKPEVPLTFEESNTESIRFVEAHWVDMQTILQKSFQSEAVVAERGDAWSEQDQEDLTAASLRYAETRYPEEEIV